MVLIEATTAAKTTDKVSIPFTRCPATLVASGLSAGEEIALQITADDGSTWEALTLLSNDVVLSADNKAKSIFTPFVFRLVKGVTLNPVKVVMLINEDGTGVKL